MRSYFLWVLNVVAGLNFNGISNSAVTTCTCFNDVGLSRPRKEPKSPPCEAKASPAVTLGPSFCFLIPMSTHLAYLSDEKGVLKAYSYRSPNSTMNEEKFERKKV